MGLAGAARHPVGREGLPKPEQAWRYLRVIDRSPEAQALCEWLDDHPGPKSRCSGKVLLLGMCLAAEIVGRCRRSDVCSAINGLPATILFHLGLCNTTTFDPVSYSAVTRQMKRLENAPFGKIMAAILGQKATPKTGPGADAGLLWFNQGMLLASVPQKVLEKVTAGAVDATAFATNARVTDYRRQAAVDKMLRDSLLNGTPLPDGLIVGPDGKIQRCKADIEARTGVRGASRATNHKKAYFTGYMATTVAASLDLRDHPDPAKVPPEESIGPYLLGFSLDPATINRAPVGRDVVLSLQNALPDLNIISADREFTVRPRFVLPVHEADIAIIMDYPEPYTKQTAIVRVGKRGERLLQSCGDFFPLWTPTRFLHPPSPSLTQEQLYDWYEERAKFRYVPNGPSRGGTIQFKCPQCAGNVIGAANTRAGHYRNRPHPKGVPSLGPPFAQTWCCNGLLNIRPDELNQWQPEPWGTRSHDDFYRWGRSRIENTNNLAKKDGAMHPEACAAPGTRAHNMAALAVFLANNVTLAAADPLRDPQPADMPEAEPSLFCVTTALAQRQRNSGAAQVATRAVRN